MYIHISVTTRVSLGHVGAYCIYLMCTLTPSKLGAMPEIYNLEYRDWLQTIFPAWSKVLLQTLFLKISGHYFGVYTNSTTQKDGMQPHLQIEHVKVLKKRSTRKVLKF